MIFPDDPTPYFTALGGLVTAFAGIFGVNRFRNRDNSNRYDSEKERHKRMIVALGRVEAAVISLNTDNESRGEKRAEQIVTAIDRQTTAVQALAVEVARK